MATRTKMKAERCEFSHFVIHPGHGMRVTQRDGKTVYLLSTKTRSLYLQKKNPRKLAWTVFYRHKHKKGTGQGGNQKKRARKVIKFQRAIGEMTSADLLKKKNESSEKRKLLRDQQIRAAKDKAKAKAKSGSKNKSGGKKQSVPKNQKGGKSAPSKNIGQRK